MLGVEGLVAGSMRGAAGPGAAPSLALGRHSHLVMAVALHGEVTVK